MKNIELIRYITQHPEYTIIVLNDSDTEMTPLTAIYELTFMDHAVFNINGSLEKDTLLLYTL